MGECEICGKKSEDFSHVKIEGTVFKVCDNCKALGKEVKGVSEVEEKKRSQPQRKTKRNPEIVRKGNEVLVPSYGDKIRKGREKSNLKQKELADSLNEKLSEIKAIESGKRKPPINLAKKLEKALNIKLREKE